jgi:hypothetical protein
MSSFWQLSSVPLLMAVYGSLAAGQQVAGQQEAAHSIQLQDVTSATAIRFRHTDGSCGQRYIVENMTAGLALLDYNGDGLIDIYFVNGAPTRGCIVDAPPTNALYRNDGNWRFTDVTQQAGVGDTGFGLGVAVGDYDNDGHPDIYVSNFGPNVLYHNQGDGTFTNVTAEAGVGAGNKFGAGTCFLDIEGDGDLDLFCANYVNFTYENHVSRTVHGFPQYAGPKDYESVADILFRNNGDGTFTDISDEAGIAQYQGSGMGTVCLDYDNDGDTDIVVVNDVQANFLYQNDGAGKFDEVGTLVGVAYNGDGDALGSMGVDCGDYDNDGWLDLFQTSYAGELPVLYRNTGIGFFEDVTRATGAGTSTLPHVNWGTGFVDFDNDGRRDLYIANGHLQDNIQEYDDSTAFEVRNTLLRNTGEAGFADISNVSGDGLLVKKSSRGIGLDDLDNDGDVDVVVLNARSEPSILRNDSRTGHHWMQIQLRGVTSNRDGVGARVCVIAGDLSQWAEVHSGRGYQSHFGTRLHFGVGPRPRVDRVVVRWIGGKTEAFEDLTVDQLLILTEGQGRTPQ